MTDDEIRISVAIFADGCFYSETSKKCMISVTKKRKRDRLVELLTSANIDFSERLDNDGYYNIKFYPPINGRQKTFPVEWYNCSNHQLQVIFEEVFRWDGYEKKMNQYTTIYKENADFIQFVCSSLNKSSSIYRDNRTRNGMSSRTCYRVDWTNRVLRSIVEKPRKEIPLVMPNDGLEYCFTVPSSMLVLRRNDNIFITGNCGSLHVLAFFDPIDGNLQEVYFNKGSTGGCVDKDTEYFNGIEWKKISEYNMDEYEQVLQYNEDGTASLTYPISYVVNDNVENMKYFHNTTGLDMVLSEDHRMYLYKNYAKYMSGIRSKLTHEIITVKDFMSGSKNRHIPTTFSMNTNGIPLSNEIIRLLVAIYADGTFDGNKIVINVKKDRKKIRIRQLLTNCDIGWTEKNINNTEYTVFYIHPTPSVKQWFIDKQFTPKWYACNDEQLKCIVDECVYWDGSVGEGNRLGSYYTSKKHEADFIQFALTRLGFRATISLNNGTQNIQDSYRVRWTTQNVHGLSTATIEDYKPIDGKSYCFTVPSGLLVLRRNGKIFITGNCANFMTGLSRMVSLLCRAGVDITTIKDQLDSTGVCPSYATRKATHHDTSKGSCCPMAIGNALVEMYNEMQAELDDKEDDIAITSRKLNKASKTIAENFDKATEAINKVADKIYQMTKDSGNVYNAPTEVCPECGEPIVHIGGCVQCPNCSWSRCE